MLRLGELKTKGLEGNRKANVVNTVNAFKNSVNDAQFINFLNKLSIEAQETFFYIDVQRALQFIAELSFDKENPVTIEDLKNDNFTSKLPMNSFNSKRGVQSIIQYWDMFGEIPKPSKELRQEVIDIHEKHFKKLSSNEKYFFLDC